MQDVPSSHSPGAVPPAGLRGRPFSSNLAPMAILNKRNAVVGWVTLKVGKRVVKQKAAAAAPSAKTGGAAAGALAAIGGVLFFWRRKRGPAE